MKTKKIEIGLIAALSGLVATPGCNKQEPPSAMCYDVMVEEYMDYVCSHCNNTIKGKYGSWMIRNINTIEEFVTQMKTLGYDVVLEKTEFCPICSKKNIENPVLIFNIRFSEEAEYHTVRSNIINEYQCLYEFLLNPDEYSETADERKIAIIQKMTGLGEDLKIEE